MKCDKGSCPAFAFIIVISPFRQLIDRWSQCVQDQLSPAFDSVAYLGFGKGGHGERAEREHITGAWERSPQRGPVAEPLVGVQRGEAPLTPDQVLCPWNPLGAPPPDPRYRLALRALAMPPFAKS